MYIARARLFWMVVRVTRQHCNCSFAARLSTIPSSCWSRGSSKTRYKSTNARIVMFLSPLRAYNTAAAEMRTG